MRLSQFESIDERRKFLEKELKIKLISLGKCFVDNDEDIHCENMIGAVSLPLAVVGPLKLRGDKVRGEYYIPLATTEGALVASVNRGCKAITLSGGASVYAHRIGTTRGPVFYTKSLEQSKKFYKWIKENESQLAKISKNTSSHLKLIKTEIRTLTQYSFLRFYFDTQDAMGMNMATIATEAMVKLIEEKTKIKCLSLAGNFDIDKKPAWVNFINGRGFMVWAETIIPEKIIGDILKSTSEKIFDVWMGKCVFGSMISGSLGFNSHFANVVAALYAATGQDLAHVVEGSLGITTAKVLQNGDLYISVYIPSIMIGTVGGGTNLKTQKEALSVVGAKTSQELAEVLGTAVLAGELSLLSSLSEGSLANAHKKFGR